MINTSSAYKRAIQSNRVFSISDKFTFKNGRSTVIDMSDLCEYSINDATSDTGSFDIGAAIISEYAVTLNNTDDKFTKYNFEGVNIEAIVGLRLADGTIEKLKKGKFRVASAKRTELTISLKAYDGMLFFDRPYSESKLSYPATINQIIADACQRCQMTYDASTVVNGSFVVPERPDSDSLTFRDMISFCAQIMGTFARINHLGALSFGWYAAMIDICEGGYFDDGTPLYESGADLDGGNFNDYSSGDAYTGGSFDSMTAYHHFYDMQSKSINTDDTKITGIKVTADSEGKEAVIYGAEGYVLEISDNPLIQDKSSASKVAQYVGKKLTGMQFRPLSITVQSDPSIEAGDTAIVTDRKQMSYKCYITNNTFSLSGTESIECSAETETEKSFTKYGAATKIAEEASKDTHNQLSAYDIAVQNMNQLAANTFGFFQTTVTSEDGSVIAYRHDKKNLSESKIVYKSGIDGFFVTNDYQGTDDATTAAGKWKSGFDSNGNAVQNILSVIGINFSWARGGTLTLGGANNQSGWMQIMDAAGVKQFVADNGGISLYSGDTLLNRIGKTTMSYAKGKTVDGMSITSRRAGNNLIAFATVDSSGKLLVRAFYTDIDMPSNNKYQKGWNFLENVHFNNGKFNVLNGSSYTILEFGGTGIEEAGTSDEYTNNDKEYPVYINGPDGSVLCVHIDRMTFYRNLNMNANDITGASTIRTTDIYYSNVHVVSDERLKENFAECGIKCLDVVNEIPLFEYDWRTDGTHEEIGMIAQQVKSVRPDLCHYDEERDVESISEARLIRYLWGAVRELSAEVDGLKEEIRLLKGENDTPSLMSMDMGAWEPSEYPEDYLNDYLEKYKRFDEVEEPVKEGKDVNHNENGSL